MPKLLRLSGPEVIHILEGFRFIVHARRDKETTFDGLTI